MSRGARKFVGTLALLAGIVLYLAVAATLADFVADHWLPRLFYYAIAGVAWAFPARTVFAWMNRPQGDR